MDESKSEESFDSSEEDIYTNAVARLKALKKKEKLKSKESVDASEILDDSAPIEIIDNGKTDEVKVQNLNLVISDKNEIDDEPNTATNNKSTNSSSESNENVLEVTEEKPTHTNYVACIVLDPDDNNDSLMQSDTSKNDLSEYENFNIEVKILWQSSKLVRLDMRMHEPFQKAFEYFANLENVPVEQIILLRKDKQVKVTDTPASLGISVIDIIEGGVMDTEYIPDQDRRADNFNEEICQIKIQTSMKESFKVNLQKDQPFKLAIIQCATQLNIHESKMKLYFDGDLISPSDTPESLDFENEACIDLKIIP